jgi:hypothetical protein
LGNVQRKEIYLVHSFGGPGAWPELLLGSDEGSLTASQHAGGIMIETQVRERSHGHTGCQRDSQARFALFKQLTLL